MTSSLKSDKVIGEAPAVLMLTKTFKVLCVTKCHSRGQAARMRAIGIVISTHWHQPITGEVVLEVFGVKMGDITIPAEVRVTFDRAPCRFLYFRTGLGGTCHGIGIQAPEGLEYFDVWDLYTDELTEKGLQVGIGHQEPSTSTEPGGHIFGGLDPAYKGVSNAIMGLAKGAPILSIK